MDEKIKYDFLMSQLSHLEDLRETEKTKLSLVFHQQLQTACVLRVCKNRDLSQVCEVLRRNRNPNIAVIYDYAYANGNTYILEEKLTGTSLAQHLEDGKCFSEQETAQIIIHICNALEHLHKEQPPVVHNDINPSNIMLCEDGQIKLFDFDISRLYKKGSNRNTTLFGTEDYASPEHFGYGQSEPRTDIYCLGVTMHTMLTGSPLNEEHKSTYTGSLKGILQKCLALDPENRYASVVMLRKSLTWFLADWKAILRWFLVALAGIAVIATLLHFRSCGTEKSTPETTTAGTQSTSQTTTGETTLPGELSLPTLSATAPTQSSQTNTTAPTVQQTQTGTVNTPQQTPTGTVPSAATPSNQTPSNQTPSNQTPSNQTTIPPSNQTATKPTNQTAATTPAQPSTGTTTPTQPETVPTQPPYVDENTSNRSMATARTLQLNKMYYEELEEAGIEEWYRIDGGENGIDCWLWVDSQIEKPVYFTEFDQDGVELWTYFYGLYYLDGMGECASRITLAPNTHCYFRLVTQNQPSYAQFDPTGGYRLLLFPHKDLDSSPYKIYPIELGQEFRCRTERRCKIAVKKGKTYNVFMTNASVYCPVIVEASGANSNSFHKSASMGSTTSGTITAAEDGWIYFDITLENFVEEGLYIFRVTEQ